MTTKYIFVSIVIPGEERVPGSSRLWWISMKGDPDSDEVPLPSPPPLPNSSASAVFTIGTGPSRAEVTRRLSENAYSHVVRTIPGVSRYDGAQVGSNKECEDRFMHGAFPSPRDGDRNPWMAWGVFDGHSGWQTAEMLGKELMVIVRVCLNWDWVKEWLVSPSPSPSPSSSSSETTPVPGVNAVQYGVTEAFTFLDDVFVADAHKLTESTTYSRHEKLFKLSPAYSGSCALLALLDPTTQTLHVACTGDSRAVLGQQNPDGTWAATALSVDQNGRNPDEIARLHREHPNEPDIIAGPASRILGLICSRTFGDGSWKWSAEYQRFLRENYKGPKPLDTKFTFLTPPYLTAKPVMTSTQLDPDRPSFLIMATDGLWDWLSSQQAVDLVGKWLATDKEERKATREKAAAKVCRRRPKLRRLRAAELWRYNEERATTQDDNAAVHLVRNAFGGDHHEVVAGRFAFGAPQSRRLRDDTTVQVVFLGGERR